MKQYVATIHFTSAEEPKTLEDLIVNNTSDQVIPINVTDFHVEKVEDKE